MSDTHSKRILVHICAIIAAMAVWALPIDFLEALAGCFVIFFVISGIGERRYGRFPKPDDLRANVVEFLNLQPNGTNAPHQQTGSDNSPPVFKP